MIRGIYIRMFWILLVIVGAFFVYFSTTFADFNREINYQGKLTTNTGVAVANGTYQMEFRLYTAPTGGSAIWTEIWSGASEVPVIDGLFSVMLGSTTALTGINFDQPLYLGVTIESDSEMTPRKIIGAVPAAFQADNARTVGGVASTSLLRSDAADTLVATTTSTLLSVIQNGSGDIVNIFDGATEIFSILDGGNIGIGSTSPSALLTVGGTFRATGTTTLASTTVSSLTMNGDFITDFTGTGLTMVGGALTVSTSSLANLNATTFNGQLPSYYLDRTNHTGTQTASTISDFSTTARGLFSSTATGLTYTSGTGVFSLTAGYNIPLTASTTNWNTAYNWGNHASAGYITTITESLLDDVFAGLGTGLVHFDDSTDTVSVDALLDDTLIDNAITVAGGTLGSNSLSSGATWSTLGTLTVGDGGDRIDIASNSWDVTNGTITGATWNGDDIDISDYTNLGVTATGLALSGDNVVLSAGYNIPLTASTTEWHNAFSSSHVAVTLAGEDYLSLSTQQITANAIDPDNLSSADFGSFSCNGTTCTIDNSAVDISTHTNLSISATGLALSGDAVVLSAGYGIPLTASTTERHNFYLTPSTRINAGNHIDWTGNTLDVVTTGDWSGTFDGQEGTFYRDASNLNAGTIPSARVSGSYTGITGLATTTIASSTITTLTLNNALAITSGGTGATSASGARTNLGATTVGANIFTLTNPSAVRLIQINADNSVSTVATSTLGIAIGDTTGTLAVSRGGTGATTFTAGTLLVGNGTGAITSTTTAGLKNTLALNNVENTALSTWAGTSNLTTVGTITTGTWQGTAIGDAYITKTGDWTGTIDGNNFTGGAIATGDLLYGSGAGTIAERAIGTTGQVLSVSGGLPTWVSTSTLGFMSATTDNWVNTTGDTMSGNLAFSGTAANIALGSNWLSGDGGDEGVFVDANGNVGIGTTTTSAKLTVDGNMKVTDVARFGTNVIDLVVAGAGDVISSDSSGGMQFDNSANILYLEQDSSNTNGFAFYFRKARGMAGARSVVTSGDDIMLLRAYGMNAGSTWSESSRITFDTEGTITGAAVPGLLRFLTADATGTMQQRMFINSNGTVNIDSLTASRLVATDSSKNLTSTISLANLVASISDVSGSTGTGNLVLSASPTLTGTPVLPGTFTIGANSFIRSGAHNLTLTTTATTNVTLPTSGTLYGTAASSITSANLASSLSNETGTGVVVFGTSPTLTTPTISGLPTFSGLTANRLISTATGGVATTTITLANVVNSISDVSGSTGTGNLVLSASPTLTGTAIANAITMSAALTMSGSAANIALGSNWLSGDGADEGVYVDVNGNVGINTATTTATRFTVQGTDGALSNLIVSSGANELLIMDNSYVGITLGTSNSGVATINFADAGNGAAGMISYDHSQDRLTIGGGSVAWQLDSSIHYDTANSLQNFSSSNYSNYRYSANALAPTIGVYKARGSVSSPAIVSAGDDVLRINGYSLTDTSGIWSESARITMDSEGSISSGVAPGRLFFGTADASGTLINRVLIDSEGRMGIGETNPTYTLDVLASSTNFVSRIYNNSTTDGGDGLLIRIDDSTPTSNNEFIRFQRNGGNTLGAIVGSTTGAVSYNQTSDVRLKENFASSSYGLSDLLQVTVSDYNFIAYPGSQQNGFLAQQLLEHYPLAVTVPDDPAEAWGVDYGRVTPLIIQSIQDQQLTLVELLTTGSTTKSASLLTSLQDGHVDTVWEKMVALAKGFKDGVLSLVGVKANRVETKVLCVGDVCITEAELSELLEQQGGGVVVPPAPEETPEPPTDAGDENNDAENEENVDAGDAETDNESDNTGGETEGEGSE